jgi:hypothetical protein
MTGLMKVSSQRAHPHGSHLPLRELEAILRDVTDLVSRLPVNHPPGAAGLSFDGRIVQCRRAIAACQRAQFSPPLLRALSAKVLELEADALVVRRSFRGAKRAAAGAKGAARKPVSSRPTRRAPRER